MQDEVELAEVVAAVQTCLMEQSVDAERTRAITPYLSYQSASSFPCVPFPYRGF